jgi:glycosyltransferase involved in cell wall biosynthesis
MPKVSVIIPTYNRAAMVKRAVASILQQTYTDFEVIVADDGSNDETGDSLRHLSEKVRYVFLEHGGRSHARNHALSLTTGVYVAFLDSDDEFFPHTLGTQIEQLEKNLDYGMVYGQAICVNEQGEQISIYPAEASGWIYDQIAFYKPLTIILPTVMVRKSVLDQVGGFDEKMERFEDTDMWRRISKRYQIGAIQQPLCKILSHSGNALGNAAIELKNVKYYIDKVFREDKDAGTFFKRRGAANLFHHYGVAVWHKEDRYGGPAMRFALYALGYWPFKRQYYDMLLPLRFWKSRLSLPVTLLLRPWVAFYLVGVQLMVCCASLRLLAAHTHPKEFLRRLRKRLSCLI